MAPRMFQCFIVMSLLSVLPTSIVRAADNPSDELVKMIVKLDWRFRIENSAPPDWNKSSSSGHQGCCGHAVICGSTDEPGSRRSDGVAGRSGRSP